MPANDLLGQGLESLGLPSVGPALDTLRRYIAEIERLNPSLGLVGASGDELVIKHVLDSLAPLAIIRGLLAGRQRPRIADLGSGAGLPGIPLAIALPEAQVTLMDRMTRRVRFLESVRDLVGLANVEIVETQVEHSHGSFDLVTFRPFVPSSASFSSGSSRCAIPAAPCSPTKASTIRPVRSWRASRGSSRAPKSSRSRCFSSTTSAVRS